MTPPATDIEISTRDEFLVRNRYVLLADLILIPSAAFLAFALRFDLLFLQTRAEFLPFLGVAMVTKPTVFFLFGMYRRFWRYASLNDMLLVVMAVVTTSLTLAVISAAAVMLDVVTGFSRAVLLIDALLTFVLVGGVRAGVRVVGESRARLRTRADSAHARRVLVVGAGEAGAMVVREMQRNPQLEMRCVGFLDDDSRKHGKRIYGALVMGDTAALEQIVKVGRIDEVVIAMPRASGAVVRRVAERCQSLELRCRTMPGIFELLDDQVSISRLRQVEISDLLRRSQIHLTDGADSYLEGRTVLITGAGGSIGSELGRQVARARPRTLVLLGHGENSIFDAQGDICRTFPGLHVVSTIADIRDARRLVGILTRVRPDVVFHAAAHKHVPLMEDNPQEAISNNVIGTNNVVNAALAAGVARLVMISTDKAVAPVSLMGASKRMAEMIVRDAARRSGRAFGVVRFGNVLGSRGSVVPIFKQQIAQGGPITITHQDMRRYFMTIPEAVHLVIQAGGRSRGGELFVLNMGQPVRILDLAEDLIRLSGFQRNEIAISFTGLRPGEKLEEELWEQDALVESVDHPDLLRITEPDEPDSATLAAAIRTLSAEGALDDRMTIEAALATCISSFVPALGGMPARQPLRRLQ